MYAFILNMWIMRRVDETKVKAYVTKSYITRDEANVILATPQLETFAQ